MYWLWRAVDQDGYELDILLQTRRTAKCAVRFFKKLLKGLAYVPRVMITDKLASYHKAKKACLKSVEHRAHKGLNNRAENSHQPTRQFRCLRFNSFFTARAARLAMWWHWFCLPQQDFHLQGDCALS
jgi:transposase-like protein